MRYCMNCKQDVQEHRVQVNYLGCFLCILFGLGASFLWPMLGGLAGGREGMMLGLLLGGGPGYFGWFLLVFGGFWFVVNLLRSAHHAMDVPTCPKCGLSDFGVLVTTPAVKKDDEKPSEYYL